VRIKGRVFRFGDNIDTDVIIPAKYLVSSCPRELARHCMEPLRKELYKEVKRGDIIVAGDNFGCGSSREHAPLSIKGLGIGCVIARSFARIFFRNAINIGLPVIELRQAHHIKEKDLLEIDFFRGKIRNITQNEEYLFKGYPQFLMEIIKRGGLLKWLKNHTTLP